MLSQLAELGHALGCIVFALMLIKALADEFDR